MRRVAIANQKGGAAKTTTTINLAAALAELGRKVLVIDLDPQGNSTDWLGAGGADRGVFEFLTDSVGLGDVADSSPTAGVAVVPATRALQGAERALAREVGAELTLQRKLKSPAALSWDYVLIDTPPTLGILTLNALTAARELIVPVEAHVWRWPAWHSSSDDEHRRERLNPDLTLAGIVACRVDRNAAFGVVDSLLGSSRSDVSDRDPRRTSGWRAPSFRRHRPD
jgi:chromosome partitioning protein